MRTVRRNKGIAMVLVIGFSLVIFSTVMALLFILRANLRNLVAFKERAEAYYLCETGASIAILDIARGHIGSGSGQWTERDISYSMGGQTYTIHYAVTTSAGQWSVVSSVGPSSGFYKTYNLRVGGRRSFPMFIRGFGGG
jgi:hypothetical protein